MINSMNQYPFVTAILVTYNEEKYVKASLLSLINQSYPADWYEIIVVDGMSTDSTLSVVNELVTEYSIENVRILKNEKKILASGWNIGIKEAKGEYVVRIDAHATVKKDFIERNVQTLLRIPEAVCVGGKLVTKSLDDSNEIVSKVLSSPFGVGNSSFRVSDEEGFVDTAVYGMYRKSIFKKVGLFNEKLVRNQDIELHSRIKKSGGKFYFNPQIKSIYFARNTISKMAKQAIGNGKWNMILLKNHSSALSFRHLVPFIFVCFIITTSLGGIFCKWIWKIEISTIVLYLILGFIAALKKTKKISELLLMPMIFFVLHMSYGIGYLVGVCYKKEKGR